MMTANYFKQVRGRPLYIYEISGDENTVANYIKFTGKYHRTSESGKPFYFTKIYSGNERPFVWYKNNYTVEIKKLIFLLPAFKELNHNLWKIIDHSISKDPRATKAITLWSTNRTSNPNFNNDVHKLPIQLKDNLFKVLTDYKIVISDHAKLNEKEADVEIEEIEESENDDYSYGSSYSEYGGAHGYDDDTINNAFEGDPDNYWNID